MCTFKRIHFNIVMSSAIFPVETSTVTVDPSDAVALFANTFVSGATAAVADGMSVAMPAEVAAAILIARPDYLTSIDPYIPIEIMGIVALRTAYRAGIVSNDQYLTCLCAKTELPFIDKMICEFVTSIPPVCNSYKIPDAFMLMHPDIIFEDGTTPLMQACYARKPELAVQIINTGRSNLMHIAKHGSTALMYACQSCVEVSEQIMSMVEPSHIALVNKHGFTALLYTLKSWVIWGVKNSSNKKTCISTAKAILASGHSNLNHQTIVGVTALMMACTERLASIALELITLGADTTCVDSNKTTALMMACCKHLPKVAMAILASPGNGCPMQINSDGNTATTYAQENLLFGVVAEIRRLSTTE
jgi:ankyrin repeat protein